MEERAAHYRSEWVLQASCQHTFGFLVEYRSEEGNEGLEELILAQNDFLIRLIE